MPKNITNTALAEVKVTSLIRKFAFPAIMAVQIVMNHILGYYGAGNYQRVMNTFRYTVIIATIVSAVAFSL